MLSNDGAGVRLLEGYAGLAREAAGKTIQALDVAFSQEQENNSSRSVLVDEKLPTHSSSTKAKRTDLVHMFRVE
jgi:hypothetical protein